MFTVTVTVGAATNDVRYADRRLGAERPEQCQQSWSIRTNNVTYFGSLR